MSKEFLAQDKPNTQSKSPKKLILKSVLAVVAFVMIIGIVYDVDLIIQIGIWFVYLVGGIVFFVPAVLTLLLFGFKAPAYIGLSSLVGWCIVLYVLVPGAIILIRKRRRKKRSKNCS